MSPRVQLLGHMVHACLVLKGTAKQFSRVTTLLHFPEEYISNPLLHILASIWFISFFIFAILIGVQCYLVILVCMSRMADDVEHAYMCLFSICVTSSANYLLVSFAHFIIGFFFVLLNFGSFCLI